MVRAKLRAVATNHHIITVSTDGSCLRNPGGAIGWAWVDHNGSRFDAGGAASGTNQIAELTAVLQAVISNPGPAPLLIEADSQYAIRCSSEWLPGWKRKGWRTASGGQIKNLEIIKAIDDAIASREGPVRFRWVRGHIGHQFNERADQLAGIAARDWEAGRGVYADSLVGEVSEVVSAAPVPDVTFRSVASNTTLTSQVFASVSPNGSSNSGKSRSAEPVQPTLF
jgi:ribonuclease HI